MSRKRVVLVCMVDSIHVARWIAQFEPSEVEFTLFPSTPNRRVHSMIKDVMAKHGNIKIVPFGGKLSIPLWGMDLIFSDYVRGLLLRGVIRRQQPDFVHALELQHGGYIASRALEDSSIKTQFIATNYGSDIFWFQQFPKHLAKIKKLLARADRYSAECNRDVELAKKYGFTGEVMPVFPNAGGFTEEQLSRPLTPTSERKIIAIKGYQGWSGRAAIAVEALSKCAPELRDFELVFYSTSSVLRTPLKKLKARTGLKITLFKKGQLSHREVLDILSKSRCYIGVSVTDGISTSALEAMAMGAFPIQSSTSCLAEWLEDGVTGFLSGSFDPDRVSVQILNMLENDNLVDDAQVKNRNTLLNRLARSQIISKSQAFYVP